MSQSENTALARRGFDDVWNERREADGRRVEGRDSSHQRRLMQELQDAAHGAR